MHCNREGKPTHTKGGNNVVPRPLPPFYYRGIGRGTNLGYGLLFPSHKRERHIVRVWNVRCTRIVLGQSITDGVESIEKLARHERRRFNGIAECEYRPYCPYVFAFVSTLDMALRHLRRDWSVCPRRECIRPRFCLPLCTSVSCTHQTY